MDFQLGPTSGIGKGRSPSSSSLSSLIFRSTYVVDYHEDCDLHVCYMVDVADEYVDVHTGFVMLISVLKTVILGDYNLDNRV